MISDRYRIRRKLGAGSIGSVYLARDEVADRLVAVKLIKGERLGPRGLEELQREFRSIVSLHHPQIATAYDFGYTEGGRVPFYTREYIDVGETPAASGVDQGPFQDGQAGVHRAGRFPEG